jgi:NADPH-dependent curcumin reductase CurA
MAAATRVNRQWRLKSRPTGLIKADNFELVSQPMPVAEAAQLLIRSAVLQGKHFLSSSLSDDGSARNR